MTDCGSYKKWLLKSNFYFCLKDGETENDRFKRLANSKARNTLVYKKDASSANLSPRNNQSTYNYNYRDPQQLPPSSLGFQSASNSNFASGSSQNFDLNSNSNMSMRNGQPPILPPINSTQPLQAYNSQPMQTQLEREANLRNIQRANSMPKGAFSELNRVSNKLYNDNLESLMVKFDAKNMVNLFLIIIIYFFI